MLVKSVALLSFIALAVSALEVNSTEDTVQFAIGQFNDQRMYYSRQEFYKLTGPDGHICLNLTTSQPIRVLFGSCTRVALLGKYESGIVALNESYIQQVIDLAYSDPICNANSIEMQIRTGEYGGSGFFSFFSCYKDVTQLLRTPAHREEILITEFKPTIKTYEDKFRTLHFQIRAGETVTEKFDFKPMLDRGILKGNSTVCFDLRGLVQANLTLSRCNTKYEVKVPIFEEKRTSLTQLNMADAYSSMHTICPGEFEDNEMLFTIETDQKFLTFASLSVFSCKNVHEQKERLRTVKDAQVGGLDRSFYFIVEPNDESIMSADLKHLIDTVSADPSRLSLTIDVTTKFPVDILISRCPRLDGNALPITTFNKTEGFALADEDVLLLRNMTMSEKCGGPEESEDALYLIVAAHDHKVVGHVQFSFEYATPPTETTERVRSRLHFNVKKHTTQIKAVALEHFFDEGLMNGHMMAIELTTDYPANIYFSKCQYSTRQLIGLHEEFGFVRIRMPQKKAIFNLFDGPACDGNEDEDYTRGFIHIEAGAEDIHGSMRFVRLNNGTKITTPDYINLENSFVAAKNNNKTMIVPYNSSMEPKEIDLRYFVEAIRSEPELSLSIEHTHSSPFTVTFHKCLNVTKDNAEDGYEMKLANTTILSSAQVAEIRYIIKSSRCDNKSRYGIFAVVKDADYNGNLTMSLEKFGRKMRHNEFFLVREMPRHHDMK